MWDYTLPFQRSNDRGRITASRCVRQDRNDTKLLTDRFCLVGTTPLSNMTSSTQQQRCFKDQYHKPASLVSMFSNASFTTSR